MISNVKKKTTIIKYFYDLRVWLVMWFIISDAVIIIIIIDSFFWEID